MTAGGVPRAILHVPHSSLVIPEAIRHDLILSPPELERELLAMTDRYTDELFSLSPEETTTVTFPVSRLVVDPERFLTDAEEPMAAKGMGVVYLKGSQGQLLREGLTDLARTVLIDAFYVPHHAALTASVDAALSQWGSALVIDCHSFPSCPSPYESDQDSDRPEICLGTDSFHTPKCLEDVAETAFRRVVSSVAINRPFAGALIPAKHYRRDPRVHALMIEVNRVLYMDESTGLRLDSFSRIASLIQETVRAIIRRAAAACGVAS